MGATVVDCGVLVGLQICQKTEVAEPPETEAANCTELFTRTVTPLTDALELTALTVTATGVEFDAQPPAHRARSISTAPSPAAFMSLPPGNDRFNVPSFKLQWAKRNHFERPPQLHQNVRLTANRNVVFCSNKLGGTVCEDRVSVRKL